MRRNEGALHPLVLIVAAGLAAGATAQPDWRLELLEDEGIATQTAELREIHEGFAVSRKRLAAAIMRLGAEEFRVREAAQREIVLMGNKILPQLRELPRNEDPEVRVRLLEIQRLLGSKGRWSREELLRYAVASLLRERGGAHGPADTIFVEFFRQAKPSLEGGYRRFNFMADEGMGGLVSDGVLRLRGNHVSDGDQQLVLTAKELTGKETFPDEFRIEVGLGGEAGGEGGYHLGVSVGRVRALFHPGYPGGGFRFEQIGSHLQLTNNAMMGFDPATGALQRMSVGVKRLAGDEIEFDVKVTSADGAKVYSERKVIKAATVGKLDAIGLDRSGRSGGDALFDDFVVELGAR